MQGIHPIESDGGGARLFTGGGDRRLRTQHDHHQDLKCPRCDSLNTKFCYYNNYNLSQPRHFCKSCRRYWTKGGVLRNVPVGGGIRKTKGSKPKSKKSAVRSSDAVPLERKSSNSENSSSDSSSLTGNTTVANTTATTTPIATTDVSGSNSTNLTSTLLNFNESSTKFFNIRKSYAPSTAFEPLMLNQPSAGNNSSEIGTFTSLMTSSTDQLPLAFNSAADTSSFSLHQQDAYHVVEHLQHPNQFQCIHSDVKMHEMGSVGFMDQTAEIELSRLESRRSNGGLAGTNEWQGSAGQALFDLTGTVDQSYWSQNQWNVDDHDHHLNYLP